MIDRTTFNNFMREANEKQLSPLQSHEVFTVLNHIDQGDLSGLCSEERFKNMLTRVKMELDNVLSLTGVETEGEPFLLEKTEDTIGTSALFSSMVKLANDIHYYLAPVIETGDIHSENGDYYLNDNRLSSGDVLEVLVMDEDGRAYWRETAIEYDSEKSDYYFTRLPKLPLEGATVRLK